MEQFHCSLGASKMSRRNNCISDWGKNAPEVWATYTQNQFFFFCEYLFSIDRALLLMRFILQASDTYLYLSGIHFFARSGRVEIQPPKSFTADRPFFYAIVEKTLTNVFSGRFLSGSNWFFIILKMSFGVQENKCVQVAYLSPYKKHYIYFHWIVIIIFRNWGDTREIGCILWTP